VGTAGAQFAAKARLEVSREKKGSVSSMEQIQALELKQKFSSNQRGL